MKTSFAKVFLPYLLAVIVSTPFTVLAQQKLGVFTGQADIGTVMHAGSAMYQPGEQRYEVSGSGANIWNDHDEFHYVYKKLSGDFILQARVQFSGKGTDPHRKTGWMVRSNLDSTAAMVSTTIHGDGLTSLQFRKQPATNIEEIKTSLSAPDVIQLERKGNRYILSAAHFGDTFTTVQMDDLNIGDDVYVGLFVCAHHKEVVEKAMFDNVRIIIPAKDSFVPYKDYIGSHIETLDVASGHREILYTAPVSLQAPNWLKNNQGLIYNSNGLIYRFDFATQSPKVVNTGEVKNNNNDHVLSFDGKMLGLSSSSPDRKYNSVVYTVPVTGGVPKQITPIGLSYLHGWSPDGKYLIYTGQRNNEFDIYRIPANGGPEVRLTTSPGLDDGSEYSPDGNYIYFNSVRSGLMQLWRMKADGSGQEQLTADEYNNWFPHISPDGKWIVFLSFMKDIDPNDHPFYKRVYLRKMPANGGTPTVIAYVYGGQGTINTPSWSPDSKKVAFVSNSAMDAQ